MITEEWNSEATPYIRGADLPGKFILDKIIVHWGEGLNEGSEHIVETTKYGGEVRLDHYDLPCKTHCYRFSSCTTVTSIKAFKRQSIIR